MKQQFMKDLQLIYDELQSRQTELNDFYKILDKDQVATVPKRVDEIVDSFLSLMGLERDDETIMATLTRIVNLREDALEQVLKKSGLSSDEIVTKKDMAYGFVSTMHIDRHERFITWVEANNLFTPFYRSLMLGIHFVGVRLSIWQSSWTDHIINGVNRELNDRFEGIDADVFAMLQERDLLDRDGSGEIADRCYSVLMQDDSGEYVSRAYADAFPDEVAGVTKALTHLMMLIAEHEDEVFHQKSEWIAYFTAIKEAFAHTKIDELVSKWSEVDRRWMSITTPLQVGHPLEYYEDHYRKAVALEWDLRIVNSRLQDDSTTKESIKRFSSEMARGYGLEAERIMSKNTAQVDETQLYIGQPILYYAAEFNGLFSAQVVPNDEQVSAELGKKIFAYADFVMSSKKSKPIMKLSVEIMGEDFVQKQRSLVDTQPKLWHEIYDISTVGHEYGHILWIDTDTESSMNSSGQFKNIEEFKATTGGLMAFFYHEREELKRHIVDDLVSRAVGLMAWQEVGEVLPYYCEGLIHLDILFSSGVISYNNQIEIDYSRYDEMKRVYQEAYAKLAQSYLSKEDASIYLSSYTIKEGGIYLPIKDDIREFVEYYYERYKEIGQQTV